MKEEQKIKLKKIICSLIFNIVEISIIILLGLLMQVKLDRILILFILFFIARMTCYKPMHYKSPILCMIWSTLVFCSFFWLTKVNILLAIVMTIFEAIILTGKGDIADGLMYRKNENERKYRELKEYVNKYKNTNELKRFENIIKDFNGKYNDRYKINLYAIYYLIFYENMSYEKVKEEMNLRNDNHIITNALDMIFICFDTYIELEKYYKKLNQKELIKK